MTHLNRPTNESADPDMEMASRDSMLRAERLLDELEIGVAAEHWERLPGLAAQLRKSLEHLAAELRRIAAQLPARVFTELLQRLAQLERRHGEVVRQLLAARERTGDELGEVVRGHRVAARYLTAAGGA